MTRNRIYNLALLDSSESPPMLIGHLALHKLLHSPLYSRLEKCILSSFYIPNPINFNLFLLPNYSK